MIGRPGRALAVLLSLMLALTLLSACGKKAPPRWVKKKPPAALNGVQVHYRPDRIVVEWKPAKVTVKAKEHVVYRSVDGGEFQEVYVLVDAPRYVDLDVDPHLSYRYKIVPRGEDGLEGKAAVTESVGADDSLPAPANVNVKIAPDGVVLAWEPDIAVSGYNVYRSVNMDSFPPAPRNKKPVTDEKFEELPEMDKSYYYTVRAAMLSPGEDLYVEGPRSLVVTVVPEDFVPMAPGGLDAAVAGEKVVVFWNESPEIWVRGYIVYRAVGESGEFKEVGSPKSLAFPDREPPRGVVLKYRVTAVGPALEGPPSETVRVVY